MKAAPERFTPLSDALEWYFRWIHTTMNSPSREIFFVKRLRALEIELVQRRNRDTETMRRLDERIGELKRLETYRVGMSKSFLDSIQRTRMELESIKTDLEATPTPVGAEKL